MSKVVFKDILYIKGRIGWQALKKDEYLNKGEYYLITGVDITNENRINFDNCYYVSKERYDMDENIQVKEGDIIVTKDGTIGKIAIIDKLNKPATLNSHLFLIRNLREDILNTQFLFYIFRSNMFQKYAVNNTSGSNIPAFTQKNISEFSIELPNLIMQKKIANILKNIDQKIINNNKTNEELENMAKTIYDYWFLQFDFPDENGKPYKSCGGKMVWNEELKKEIPEGWEVKSLLELSDLNNGINYDKNENGDKKYKIVNVRNITASTLLINNMDLDLINLKSLLADKYLVEEDDILIARSGTPGAVRLMEGKNNDIIYCGFIIRCKPKRAELRYYLTYLLKIYEGSHVTKTGGSIMQNVSQNTLSQLQICVPSDKILYKYNQKIKIIISMMQSIIKENQTLKELRDFLLPLLMNGQVGFKEE